MGEEQSLIKKLKLKISTCARDYKTIRYGPMIAMCRISNGEQKISSNFISSHYCSQNYILIISKNVVYHMMYTHTISRKNYFIFIYYIRVV